MVGSSFPKYTSLIQFSSLPTSLQNLSASPSVGSRAVWPPFPFREIALNIIRNERYARDETVEFLKPIIVNENAKVGDGDVLIFFNYRSGRMREIVEAIGIPKTPSLFEEIKVRPKNLVRNCSYNLFMIAY